MKAKTLPTQSFLLECFQYEPLTGKLFWKERPPHTFVGTANRTAEHIASNFNTRFAHQEAFTSPAVNGYLRGAINNETWLAHRVIWEILYGTEPKHIDHDDGIRSNNRQNNLLSKDVSGNMKNRCLSKNNTSGHHGVSFSTRHNLWSVTIYDKGNKIHLGWFKTKEEGIVARKEAELTYGYHPNHGRPA